jgi:heterodisulfide reductase subunit C
VAVNIYKKRKKRTHTYSHIYIIYMQQSAHQCFHCGVSTAVFPQASVEAYFESVLRKQKELEAAEQKEARPVVLTPSVYASTQVTATTR